MTHPIVSTGETGGLSSIPGGPALPLCTENIIRIDWPKESPTANTRANSKAFSRIPYEIEQGIISAEQGLPAQEQGNLTAKSEISTG